ncbi:MAG: hypothetical protein ABR83_00440 [Cryomorphaceae bacterium BACL18 MAG-120924-bin36]|nr:MAG: hypothetical protein ABR83_00440 [Cryomorphaceae bacterium BACL18 MAG-120924-bin36]
MWASLLGSLVLAGGLWLSAPWLASAYGGFAGLWRATAVVLPLWTLVQVWSEVCRAQHRYLGFGLLQNSILLGIVAAAMALLPWFSSVERVLWGLAASAALLLGRGWLDLRPSSLAKPVGLSGSGHRDVLDRNPLHGHDLDRHPHAGLLFGA